MIRGYLTLPVVINQRVRKKREGEAKESKAPPQIGGALGLVFGSLGPFVSSIRYGTNTLYCVLGALTPPSFQPSHFNPISKPNPDPTVRVRYDTPLEEPSNLILMASSTPVDKSPPFEGASGEFSNFHFPFSDVAGISQVCPTIPHAINQHPYHMSMLWEST